MLRNFISNASAIIGGIRYDFPDPNRTTVIDLHQYSGVIKDPIKLKENAAAVLIKLTNGKEDSKYGLENWEICRKHGIPRGSWGWLYSSRNVSVNAQARKAVAVLKDDPGELPFFVDYETTRWNFQISNPNVSDLWSFLSVYENESGRVGGIYTGYYFWIENGSTHLGLERHPLWIAGYETSQPAIPQPWTEYMFWQWTENGYGIDYGIDPYAERAVDLNYTAEPIAPQFPKKIYVYSDGGVL